MIAPRISPPRPIEAQQVLFRDVHRIESPAATRNLVGDFYEEAARVMLGANRHTTDGRCEICPDLSLPWNVYLENKSIGRNRQGLIYAKRLEKDARLVKATGCQLFYVFWCHNVEATKYSTVEELHQALAQGVRCVLVVPFAAIRRACARMTPRVMNYRHGARGRQDMPGFRLSWSLLEELSAGKARISLPVGDVFGVHVGKVEVRGPDIAVLLPPLTEHQRDTAAELLAELSTNRLRVVAQEATEQRHPGHKVRVVESENPPWYRKLCADHVRTDRTRKNRRPDTAIQRPRAEESLDRLSRGICRFPYDWMLRPIVEAHAARAFAHLEPAPF